MKGVNTRRVREVERVLKGSHLNKKKENGQIPGED